MDRTTHRSYAAIEWSPEQDAEEILGESIRKAFGGRPPAGLTQRTLLGAPARTLIGLSENCYMLVLGSRGHGGFAGLLWDRSAPHARNTRTVPS